MVDKIKSGKVIKYWKESAERTFATAEFLFKGRWYPECLFFCHLAIEKILKALVVQKTKTHAPYTHKLIELAKLAKIDLSSEQIEHLTVITEFNIAARYNEIKFDFHQKSTKVYTEKYFMISKKLYTWLKKQISLKK